MKALFSPRGGLGSDARERMAPVTWRSVAGVSYFLERRTNLASLPPFSLLATDLPGQPGTTSFTETNTAGASLFFYRVGVGQ